MATKGQKFKQWTAEEKFEIIKPILDKEKLLCICSLTLIYT